MADSKKSALLQAANKLKNAKKNAANNQGNTKGIKNDNSAGSAIAGKIKDAVSKFDRD